MSNLFIFLHSLTGHYDLFDALVIVAARYFQYIVIVYACILMYRTLVRRQPGLNPDLYVKKATVEFVWVAASITGALIIAVSMKVLLAVPRPFLSGMHTLFVYGGYNSFPSGHATLFAALTFSMFLFHLVRGWWFLVSAIIIGLARVVAGVHYPIDIFVGYMIGALSAYLICMYIRPWITKSFNFFDY